MIEDKKRGFAPKPATCGVCEITEYPCPTCPRMDGKSAPRDRTWDQVTGHDPELAAVMKANARAARNIVIRNPGDQGYSEWVTEYQKQGDRLRALYVRRPALLGVDATHEVRGISGQRGGEVGSEAGAGGNVG